MGANSSAFPDIATVIRLQTAYGKDQNKLKDRLFYAKILFLNFCNGTLTVMLIFNTQHCSTAQP